MVLKIIAVVPLKEYQEMEKAEILEKRPQP
jgi:hypothetical protein